MIRRFTPIFVFFFLATTGLGIGVVGVVTHTADAVTTSVNPESYNENFWEDANREKIISNINGDAASVIGNKDRMRDCAGDIYSLFQRDLDEEVENFAKSAAKQAVDAFKRALGQAAVCAAQAALGLLGINPPLTCTISFGDYSSGVLLDQWKAQARQQFLGACTAAYSSFYVQDTARDIVNNQGPGGGPAYVTDWRAHLSSRPDEEAQRRFWALLANTDICPYFRDDMLDAFSVPQEYRSSKPPINAMSLRTTAGDPFTVRGQCTLPEGYTPGLAMTDSTSYTASLMLLVQPQNNPGGFYQMAVSELSAQRAVTAQSAYAEAVGGGGYLSSYGTNGCLPDPANPSECITYGTIQQPARGVGDNINLANNMEMMRVFGSVENDLMEDVAARLQVSMLSLANKPLQVNLRPSAHYEATRATPPPTPTPVPGSDDPACTDGDVRCSCVTNDQNYILVARGIGGVLKQTLKNWNNPDIGVTDANGNRVLSLPFGLSFLPDEYYNAHLIPGGEWGRIFLANACNLIGSSSCKPHPTRDTDLVLTLGNGMSVSFQGLIPSTDTVGQATFTVLVDQPIPRALCEPGVQD